jgi:hypothetical protein
MSDFRARQESALTRTRRRVVLLVTSGVLAATLGFGGAASAIGPNGQERRPIPASYVPPIAGATTSSAKAVTAYVGAANPSLLRSVSTTLGHAFTYASDSFDGRSWAGIDNDQWAIQAWRSSGYTMVWALQMLPSTPGVSLAVGATGAYDAYFTTLAQNLVAAGMGNSILRIGWEFNQPLFSWYAAGQATNYVNYWRQIVTTMRAVPGAQFRFEWNPSRGDNGPKDKAMGNLADYYPGDSYVDIVGMDIYDNSWNIYPGASAEFQDFSTQTWGLNWLVSFGAAHGKPLAIPEMGLGSGPSAPNSGPIVGNGQLSGGDDPTFITDMLNWVAQNNVVNVAYWDYQSSTIQNGQNPATAAALRQWLTQGG